MNILNKLNILIAEDDSIIQEMYKDFFTLHLGFNCDFANNGVEAVSLASKKKYDFGLFDLDMPNLSGLEAVGKIRKLVKYFPIVIATASTRVNIEDCFKKGADGLLNKPFLLDDKIKSLINKLTSIYQYGLDSISNKIKKRVPMSNYEAKELKELKERGLSLISVFGTSTEATFVVNEKVPEYIEIEFANNEKRSVQFLDHKPDSRGFCRLFSKNSMIVKTHTSENEFEALKEKEEERLKSISFN